MPLTGAASYIVFAHLCDARARTTVAGQTSDYPNPVVTAPGEHLADYVIEYTDGTEHRVPVRRRFEVNQVMTRKQSGFLNRPHQGLTPLPMRGPYPADMWGRYQTGVYVGPAGRPPAPRDDLRGRTHPAPRGRSTRCRTRSPQKTLRALRLEPTGAAAIGIGAVTLFEGAHHPLRHERLESVRVTLPRGPMRRGRRGRGDRPWRDRPAVRGARRRRRRVGSAPAVKGRGEAPEAPTKSLVLDVAGSKDATLTRGRPGGLARRCVAGRRARQQRRTGSVELLTPRRAWLNCKVVDAATGGPTPARVHFRAEDGRYFPPYGHRHEVNDNWFEDYGADVKLGDTPYAYVDGTFRAELPVGEVFVEASKGSSTSRSARDSR